METEEREVFNIIKLGVDCYKLQDLLKFTEKGGVLGKEKLKFKLCSRILSVESRKVGRVVLEEMNKILSEDKKTSQFT